jgi:hypothetical protein
MSGESIGGYNARQARGQGAAEELIVYSSTRKRQPTVISRKEEWSGAPQGGHKNRETENRTEAETGLTEISVFFH